MIKNGHHTTSEPGKDAEPDRDGIGRSPEKRKRTVRVWCDGW